ncbi:MAG TPA: cupin domain-containing protein [Gaiellaceae bacterium]|nr:cupin domain-containing protein [Gaiellaceae bacterium]
MQRLSFAEGYEPDSPLLAGATIAPLTSPIRAGAPFQAAIFRLEPGGRVARHPAAVPQLLAVLEGSGVVSGADGVEEPIGVGEAVVWDEGEEHETRTETGLVALILEGRGLLLG